ncbi:hypothetical protein Adt_46412 [Abeliophyllum distichum]|uniref:Uncharacterized protein n=1 Tax=Abeliophyllum distichum TaxID=126358 RepID=A0ABD1P0E2_9LAMI
MWNAGSNWTSCPIATSIPHKFLLKEEVKGSNHWGRDVNPVWSPTSSGKTNNIQNPVDSSYEDWWNNEVLPRLNKVQVKEFLSNEDVDFRLEQPVPIPKHTKNNNAKEINTSCVASQRTFQKKALDVPDEGGPKRLKFMFPSTGNVSSSEHVEKIPGTIFVSEDSNFRDQAFQGLEATLILECSSSKDHIRPARMIDVLDGIDGLNSSKDISCDYPSHTSGGISASKLADINDEGEVNSRTLVCKIPKNGQDTPVTPSSLSLIVVPTSNINNRGIAPICSSMSGLLLRII